MLNHGKKIFLFIGNIDGYEEQMMQDVPTAMDWLDKYQQIADQALEQCHRVLQKDHFGEACKAVFESPENAVVCALKLRESFQNQTDFQVPLLVADDEVSEERLKYTEHSNGLVIMPNCTCSAQQPSGNY